MNSSNYSPICEYRKAQIGMQVARKIFEKKRSLLPINEHFSREFYEQDAPNMGFC
jgi:hypothetical protein